MFDDWCYFSSKISLCAGAWSWSWCNSQKHRVSVYSAHSLTIYRTSHSTRLQWILSVSNVWMHFILIWVLYNFSLYTGWFRMKGEYFGRWLVSVTVRKNFMRTCLILNGYWDRAVWISKYKNIVSGNKEREMTWFNVLLTVHHDISVQWEPTGCTVYFQFISIITASQHECVTYTNCCVYTVVSPEDQQ